MYNGRAISENRLQLLKNLIIIKYLSTPRYLPKRKENICPPKDVSLNVHSSFIYDGLKVKTTQMYING